MAAVLSAVKMTTIVIRAKSVAVGVASAKISARSVAKMMTVARACSVVTTAACPHHRQVGVVVLKIATMARGANAASASTAVVRNVVATMTTAQRVRSASAINALRKAVNRGVVTTMTALKARPVSVTNALSKAAASVAVAMIVALARFVSAVNAVMAAAKVRGAATIISVVTALSVETVAVLRNRVMNAAMTISVTKVSAVWKAVALMTVAVAIPAHALETTTAKTANSVSTSNAVSNVATTGRPVPRVSNVVALALVARSVWSPSERLFVNSAGAAHPDSWRLG